MSIEKRSVILRIVAHLCALAVAGFFIYAAGSKIYYDQRQFAIEISNYRILPKEFVNIPAIILPWVEIGAAIALILTPTRRAGAILIGGMLLAFIAAVSYSALYLGLKIECGCTGKGGSEAGWLTIGRNALLLMGTLLSMVLVSRAPSRAKTLLAGGMPVALFVAAAGLSTFHRGAGIACGCPAANSRLHARALPAVPAQFT